MTRLAECAISCAFPTNRDDFFTSRRQAHSEYVKRFLGGWEQYEAVSSHLSHCIQRYRVLGVARVEERVTATQLRALMQTFKVVILFAHRIEEASGDQYIELWESKIDPESFVELVPAEFTGVIDLSVCGPGMFVDKLNRRLTRCTVGYSDKPVKPTLWAEIYGDVFEILGLNPCLD